MQRRMHPSIPRLIYKPTGRIPIKLGVINLLCISLGKPNFGSHPLNIIPALREDKSYVINHYKSNVRDISLLVLLYTCFDMVKT